MEKRHSFKGSIGFVLTAAGSAVGLGNIWRFPYLAARDCRRLCDLGFTLERYCGADLFPRTRHIECVALMTRRGTVL